MPSEKSPVLKDYTKVCLVKAVVVPVVMYGCASWTIEKAECRRIGFWTVVLKTLESPLDCEEIQSVHPKGDQSWVFTGRTDVQAETPILWPPDAKSWFTGKDPDAGKDWGQEEKGTTEDEMVRWHRRLNGHGFGWTPGVGDGQGDLVCCGSRSCRVGHDWATELNWKDYTLCDSIYTTLFRWQVYSKGNLLEVARGKRGGGWAAGVAV